MYGIDSISIGDSYAFSVSCKMANDATEDLSDYSCELVVVKYNDSSVLIERSISDLSDDNTKFLINITSDETDGLEAGIYIIAVMLSQPSTGYVSQQNFRLDITDSFFD